MKLLYLAGPYSGRTDHATKRNALNASEIALEAWRAGWCAVCPATNSAGFEHSDVAWETFADGYLSLLRKCDAVLMLPGWRVSRGATAEYKEARNLDMPILHWDGYPLRTPAEVFL